MTVTKPLAPDEEVYQPSFLRTHITRSSIYKKAFPKNGMPSVHSYVIQSTVMNLI